MRVALIGCTGLLGDVICQTITAEPDLDVVAKIVTPPVDLDLSVFNADIVLWNDADEGRVSMWLNTYTQRHGPRVLATLTDGHESALWELTPHRTELGALSPQTLVETIRESRMGEPCYRRTDERSAP